MLGEQKRRKKGTRARKTGRKEREKGGGRRERERKIERGGNFSILPGYPGPFSEPRKEGDLQFRGKNTSGYLRDKVPHQTKRLRASRIPPLNPCRTHAQSFAGSTSPRRRLEEVE